MYHYLTCTIRLGQVKTLRLPAVTEKQSEILNLILVYPLCASATTLQYDQAEHAGRLSSTTGGNVPSLMMIEAVVSDEQHRKPGLPSPCCMQPHRLGTDAAGGRVIARQGGL